jgi:hypothetical protein
LREVGVNEDQQVAGGDEERLPQGLALAGKGAEFGRDVTGAMHGPAQDPSRCGIVHIVI